MVTRRPNVVCAVRRTGPQPSGVRCAEHGEWGVGGGVYRIRTVFAEFSLYGIYTDLAGYSLYIYSPYWPCTWPCKLYEPVVRSPVTSLMFLPAAAAEVSMHHHCVDSAHLSVGNLRCDVGDVRGLIIRSSPRPGAPNKSNGK